MIELTNNIEELEKSYEDFNSLSYNLRKNANAESINKYGMDVDSFYTLLKSELSKDLILNVMKRKNILWNLTMAI